MLCALVPAALLAAPLVHLHDDSHDSAVVHSHLSEHHADHGPAHGQTLEQDDHDRAVFFTALTGLSAKTFTFAAMVTGAMLLPAPPTRTAEVPLVRTHGHDPPLVGTASLRAPPAFLS
jgi:hypothetical protein